MSEENKKSCVLPLVTVISVLFVLIVFVSYWIWLPDIKDLLNNPPSSTLPIQITGTFGDSFGFLTCLFSGLSSIGMIVAILMQREELRLQRNEIKAQKDISELHVKLAALSTLIPVYNKHIENLTNHPDSFYQKEREWAGSMRNAAMDEIGKILEQLNINLPTDERPQREV